MTFYEKKVNKKCVYQEQNWMEKKVVYPRNEEEQQETEQQTKEEQKCTIRLFDIITCLPQSH